MRIVFVPYAMYTPHRSVAYEYVHSKYNTNNTQFIHCPVRYQKRQCRFNKKGSISVCVACTLSFNEMKRSLNFQTIHPLHEVNKLPLRNDFEIFDQLINGAISSFFSSHKKLSIEGTSNISKLLDTAKDCFDYFDALFTNKKKLELILFNGRVELTWAACLAAQINNIPFKVLEVVRKNSNGAYAVEVAQNTLTHDPNHIAVQLQETKQSSSPLPIKHMNMHGKVKPVKYDDRKSITVFLKTFNEFHALGKAYSIPNTSTQATYILKLQEYCFKNRYHLIIKHHPNSSKSESQFSQLEEKVYERLSYMEHITYFSPKSVVDSHHLAKISDLNISFGGSISRYCLENEYPILLTKSERFLCHQDANKYIVPLNELIERCEHFFTSGEILGWVEMRNSLNRFNNWKSAGGIELKPVVQTSYLKKMISLVMILTKNSNHKLFKW